MTSEDGAGAVRRQGPSPAAAVGRRVEEVATVAEHERYDVVVIGAGFAGMYALRRLRDDMGLRVRVVERGDDVGGTWYWNRYPGARCDVQSLYYSYSFSSELEQEWEWTELYPAQPEILAYANHVADRFDLRRDIDFATEVESAAFDAENDEWEVRLGAAGSLRSRFLVTAVGCLSAARIPAIPGLESFAGATYHTGRWPHEGVDFRGLRVAAVGTGSSGIQLIPQLAEQAEHLTVFQRTPAYSLPARNRPLDPEEVARVKADYAGVRARNRVSPGGVPNLTPPIGSALEIDPLQAQAEMDRRWRMGGTAFMMTFNDSARNLDANAVTAQFVRDRIAETVTDAETAEKLTPRNYPIGAKRLCLDTDFHATFNRENVSLVSLADTPIERITPAGVVVDGIEHEVDAIVFATGYDAMTGPLNAIDIRGSDGELLREKWSAGPRTYLGVASAGFPNLFTVTGPGSPSVLINMFISIEQHVDWICDLVATTREQGITRVEAQVDAEDRWVEHVNEVAEHTLFTHANSWYLGANIPGKPRVFMPYVGGMVRYQETCDAVAADGYRGFTLTGPDGTPVRVREHAAAGTSTPSA